MAIFTGNWLDGSGVPFWGDAVHVDGGDRGKRAKVNRIKPIGRPTADQQAIRLAFGHIARYYSEVLTATEQLYWMNGEEATEDRQGSNVTPTDIEHYMNAQVSGYYGLGTIQPTTTLQVPYRWQNLSLFDAAEATQIITVKIDIQQYYTGPNKLAIHISQVPPAQVGKAYNWQTARWIHSEELSTSVTTPAWDTKTITANARFPLVGYELAQVYVRLTEYEYEGTPAFANRTKTRTPAWSGLTVTVTPPP